MMQQPTPPVNSNERNAQTTPSRLLSEMADDPTFIPLLEEFISGLQDRLDGMEQAWRQQAWEQLRTLAHQVKGAGGGYGYPSITDSARALEDAAAQQVEDQVASAYRQLQQLCDAAKRGLES